MYVIVPGTPLWLTATGYDDTPPIVKTCGTVAVKSHGGHREAYNSKHQLAKLWAQPAARLSTQYALNCQKTSRWRTSTWGDLDTSSTSKFSSDLSKRGSLGKRAVTKMKRQALGKEEPALLWKTQQNDVEKKTSGAAYL
ncbi:hypothetical protein KEM48_009130 [Puccinia striiformis f. sp. tritici PST-130]|nr:hypothetical protein KEM48_009130 [Puccinia striiformis f. sp. tritici PST-130]